MRDCLHGGRRRHKRILRQFTDIHPIQREIGDIGGRSGRLLGDEMVAWRHLTAADPAPLSKQRHKVVRRAGRLDHLLLLGATGRDEQRHLVVLLELVIMRQVFLG